MRDFCLPKRMRDFFILWGCMICFLGLKSFVIFYGPRGCIFFGLRSCVILFWPERLHDFNWPERLPNTFLALEVAFFFWPRGCTTFFLAEKVA